MNGKKELTEEDVKMQFITTAVINGGGSLKDQIRAEYFFTDGQITVRGKTVVSVHRKGAFRISALTKTPNIFNALPPEFFWNRERNSASRS